MLLPAVLFQWRGDAVGAAIEEGGELALVINGDALGKTLALADVDLEKAFDEQVIDLCDPAFALESQDVGRYPVAGRRVASAALQANFASRWTGAISWQPTWGGTHNNMRDRSTAQAYVSYES